MFLWCMTVVPKPDPRNPTLGLVIPKPGPGDPKPDSGGPKPGPGGPELRRNCFTSTRSSLSPGVTADYECDELVTHPGCVPSRQQNLLDPDQKQWFTDGWEFHCLENCRNPQFSHDILTFLTVQHLHMFCPPAVVEMFLGPTSRTPFRSI